MVQVLHQQLWQQQGSSGTAAQAATLTSTRKMMLNLRGSTTSKRSRAAKSTPVVVVNQELRSTLTHTHTLTHTRGTRFGSPPSFPPKSCSLRLVSDWFPVTSLALWFKFLCESRLVGLCCMGLDISHVLHCSTNMIATCLQYLCVLLLSCSHQCLGQEIALFFHNKVFLTCTCHYVVILGVVLRS